MNSLYIFLLFFISPPLCLRQPSRLVSSRWGQTQKGTHPFIRAFAHQVLCDSHFSLSLTRHVCMMATKSGGLVMMIYDPTPTRSAQPAVGCLRLNWLGFDWIGSGLIDPIGFIMLGTGLVWLGAAQLRDSSRIESLLLSSYHYAP